MAKVKNPFLSVDARGSVNGMVASRSRSGQIMKAKASPVQPRTQAQQTVRYNFAKLNREFMDLTVTQIGLWQDFAANWTSSDVFGDSIKHTALNWFEAFNSYMQRQNLTLLTEPPLVPNTDFNAYISIYQDASSPGNIFYKFTGNVSLPGNWAIWLGYSSNLPNTSNFKKGSLKFRQLINNYTTTQVTLLAASALSFDDSLRQFEWKGTDDYGRATPVQRVTIHAEAP